MKNIIFAASFALISQFSFGQTKNIGAFTDLNVFDRIPVQLVSSDDYKVEISGNKADDVQLVSSGNKLKIRMKTQKLLRGDDVKIVLYYKDIHNISARQGAKIISEEPVKTDNLELISSEGATIDLKVNTKMVDAKIKTGGSLKLDGEGFSQKIAVSTGGNYNGQSLETKVTYVFVNAGGKASVFVTESVDATTRAGGTIDIYGNPAAKNTKNVIGGKINYLH